MKVAEGRVALRNISEARERVAACRDECGRDARVTFGGTPGLKSAEKIRAVIAMWEPISLAAAGARGSRFMIGMSTGPVPKMWEVKVSEEEKAVAKNYGI